VGYPQTQDALIDAGASKLFTVTVKNTGDLGVDRYDFSVTSNWSTALLAADGLTPLVDSNGNSAIDTGALDPNVTLTFTVRVTTPANVSAGQWNATTVTLRSEKTASSAQNIVIQTAVPLPLAMAFNTGGNAQLNTLLTRLGSQHITTQTLTETKSMDTAIARRPDGGFVQMIGTRTCERVGSCDLLQYTYHIYASYISRTGQLEKNVLVVNTAMVQPAIAVAPNGNVLLAWTNNFGGSSSVIVQDIWFMILDTQGNIVHAPSSLTNLNTVESNGYAGSPAVAATLDGKFVVNWWRAYDAVDNSGTPCKRPSFGKVCALVDLYYTVMDTSGVTTKAKTRLTSDTPSGDDAFLEASLYPQGNQVLVAFTHSELQTQTIQLGKLDSAGNLTVAPITVSVEADPLGWVDTPRMTVLSNGGILLAWFQHLDGTPTALKTAVVDASLTGTPSIHTLTPNAEDQARPCCLSIAPAALGSANLVWSTLNDPVSQRVFYAVVDQSGNLLVPRTTIFNTPNAKANVTGNYNFFTYNGYGIAPDGVTTSTSIFMPLSLR